MLRTCHSASLVHWACLQNLTLYGPIAIKYGFRSQTFSPKSSLRTLHQLHGKLARKIRLKSTFYMAACKGLQFSLKPNCRGLRHLHTCTVTTMEVWFSGIQIKVSKTSPEDLTGCFWVWVTSVKECNISRTMLYQLSMKIILPWMVTRQAWLEYAKCIDLAVILYSLAKCQVCNFCDFFLTQPCLDRLQTVVSSLCVRTLITDRRCWKRNWYINKN